MRTSHMNDRMRQRGITEAEIAMIQELGEWNERADRIVLTASRCALAESVLRQEIRNAERRTGSTQMGREQEHV